MRVLSTSGHTDTKANGSKERFMGLAHLFLLARPTQDCSAKARSPVRALYPTQPATGTKGYGPMIFKVISLSLTLL